MTTIEVTAPLKRTPRHPRRQTPNDDPAFSFERLSPPGHECVDPDFDAIDVGGLLHDLAIVPAVSVGDGEC